MNCLTLGLVVLISVFFGIGSAISEVMFDWATVGNPGNTPDTRYSITGLGSVLYTYRISKYEVTNAQYVEFLNAVAASDPNGLYDTRMWSSEYGCKIERTGTDGIYEYSVATDRANRPVNYISFFDTMRFTNWLENGQPTGAQDASTTEDGVYTISDGPREVRNPNATYFIPSEDEWYKAAYYKGGDTDAGYWDYPTQSDSEPDYVNNSGNLSGTGIPFAEGGTDPGNYATYDGDGGTNGIGSPYWMTEVGEWENSESAYGTFDQGGNVWEWNETLISGSLRGLRGGSFNYDDANLYLHAAPCINTWYPESESGSVGFRVAMIPEPSSIALLIIFGNIALAYWLII